MTTKESFEYCYTMGPTRSRVRIREILGVGLCGLLSNAVHLKFNTDRDTISQSFDNFRTTILLEQ